MSKQTAGFTLIEVLVVLVLGSVLVGIGLSGFGDTQSALAVRQARNVFNGMAARTRAHAIEAGFTTVLITDARGDSVMIFKDGAVVENVRFGEEMQIDIQAESPVTTVCMNPRGFADTDCNSFSSAAQIAFVRGTRTETLEILPLGQV